MRHLLWEGRRPPAQLIKALALTLEQAAELADWSPTRTAELFAMMPGGEPLPRNVIGNQLAAIKEALNYKTPRMGGAQGT